MEIPDTEIYEIGVGILSFIGVIVGVLLKTLVDEIKRLRNSLDRVERHLSEAKEEIFKVATVVATCKSCPHPDMNSVLKIKDEENE
jgi:hypothetical protein